MEYRELIDQVAGRMGGADDVMAERAIAATLRCLGARLRWLDADAVAARLPAPFDAALRAGRGGPAGDLDGFYADVARSERVSVGFAIEHSQAVCQALMALLDQQGRAQLCIDAWPELVRGSLRELRNGVRMAPPPHGPGLAGGRPGSTHPVSEAAPPERAQRDSVVKADNPHGSRKVSSAQATPEGEERTVAGYRGSRQ